MVKLLGIFIFSGTYPLPLREGMIGGRCTDVNGLQSAGPLPIIGALGHSTCLSWRS